MKMNANLLIVIGIIAAAISAFFLPYGFYLKSQESSKSQIEYIKTLLENNREVEDSKEVKVLKDDIVDAQRGYMHIRVSKDYLNNNFKIPLTLKYTHGQYQPVMLTFKDDPKFGAGIIFVSPERKERAEIYLNQCFRFKGFGKMYYTEDLVFEFYYNDYCIYFVTNSAEIQFERQLPPIRYGRNICIGYFNQDNKEKNRNASSDFSKLEAFFKKRFEQKSIRKARP